MNKITEMYAFICTEDDGSEGVPAILLDGLWLPLMASDMNRVQNIMSHPAFMLINKPMRLVKFSDMSTIKTFNGGANESTQH